MSEKLEMHPLKQQLKDALLTYNGEMAVETLKELNHLAMLPDDVDYEALNARIGDMSFYDLSAEIFAWKGFWD